MATPEPVVTASAHTVRETSPGDTANARINNSSIATTGKPVNAANMRRRGDDANMSLKEFLSSGDQVCIPWLSQYLRAGESSLSYLTWLNRFAHVLYFSFY